LYPPQLLNQRRTSYQSIRDDLRPLFTDAVIDQTGPLWGIDEEGELKGCYRASGYPGVRLYAYLNINFLWDAHKFMNVHTALVRRR